MTGAPKVPPPPCLSPAWCDNGDDDGDDNGDGDDDDHDDNGNFLFDIYYVYHHKPNLN